MNRINRNLHMAVTALILACAAYSVDSRASGGNANFNVNITIVDNCKVSAQSMQSGDQETVRRSAGNIAVSCSKNTPAMITLNGDLNSAAASAASASLQQMASRANLSYSLNQQKGEAIGADGTQANRLVTTVYGASEARQVVPVYSDVVVATVTF